MSRASWFRLTPQGGPKLTEKDVVKACLDLLALRGWKTERLNVGKFRTVDGRWHHEGYTGRPDYLAVHRTHPAFYLETKRPGGTLSVAQTKTIFEITHCFGIAILTAFCVEDLIRFLNAHEQRTAPVKGNTPCPTE